MKIRCRRRFRQSALDAVRYRDRPRAPGLPVQCVLGNVQEPATLYEMVVAHDADVLQLASAARGRGCMRSRPATRCCSRHRAECEVASGDMRHRLVEMAERFGCVMSDRDGRARHGRAVRRVAWSGRCRSRCCAVALAGHGDRQTARRRARNPTSLGRAAGDAGAGRCITGLDGGSTRLGCRSSTRCGWRDQPRRAGGAPPRRRGIAPDRRAACATPAARSARQRSALYRELLSPAGEPVDLAALPVVTKALLMRRFDDWVADDAITLPSLHEFMADPASAALSRTLHRLGEFRDERRARRLRWDARAMAVDDALEALRRTLRPLQRMFCTGQRLAFVGAIGGHFASVVSLERLRRLNPWMSVAFHSFRSCNRPRRSSSSSMRSRRPSW